MDNDFGVSVYAEAKGEYTKQLSLYVVPNFHRFFMTCLKQATDEEPNVKRQLWKFQEILSQIPEWNVDKVQRETQKILSTIDCDYFDELITAVFIAHTKVLTAIRIVGKNKNRVQIVVPKTEHFIHRALSECSRILWSSAFLFHSDCTPMEKQKNHLQIDTLLHEGISQAIRALLPVKNILKDCIADSTDANDADDNEDDADDAPTENTPLEETPLVDSIEAPVVEAPVEVPAEVPAKEPKIETPVVETPVVETPVNLSTPHLDPVDTTTKTITGKETKSVEKLNVSKSSVAEIPKTLVVSTEPSVQFTGFDQVIQQKNGNTEIQYIEKGNDDENELVFMDDDGQSISDFEDLMEEPTTILNNDDFEQL